MCRQDYVYYYRCGCEVKGGPLLPCPFGPGSRHCFSVTNIIHPSPGPHFCPYHIGFFKRQRPVTYTKRGFELWAGGRHSGIYWPIGRNDDYHPRSWDLLGIPDEELRLVSLPTLWSLQARRDRRNKERVFGLMRAVHWENHVAARKKKRPAGPKGGYEADSETDPDDDKNRGTGYWDTHVMYSDEQLVFHPEPTAAERRQQILDQSDEYLAIEPEELDDIVPPEDPNMMWGCWDDAIITSESDVQVSELMEKDKPKDGDGDGDDEMDWLQGR